MKIVLNFLFFFSCILSIHAQEMADASDAFNYKTEKFYTITDHVVKQERLAAKQTAEVETQLRDHISQNLKYPKTMEEQGLETKLIVQLTLSNTGQITHKELINCSNSQLEMQVLEVLSSFQRVDLKEDYYFGFRKFQLPVDFNLR